jgi:hypothetical protein
MNERVLSKSIRSLLKNLETKSNSPQVVAHATKIPAHAHNIFFRAGKKTEIRTPPPRRIIRALCNAVNGLNLRESRDAVS